MFGSLFGVQWRKSPAHLLLLSKFITPESPSRFERASEPGNSWVDVLGEAPSKAIQRFEKYRMLEDAGLVGRIHVTFGVEELKKQLRSRGASTTGVKQVLVERLVETDPKGMKAATSEVTALVCTASGKEIAEEYVAQEKANRQLAEDEVWKLLHRFDYLGTSKRAIEFEKQQVFSRGLGVDWNNYDPKRLAAPVEAMFSARPKIMAKLDEYELMHLRFAAAMMELWGVGRCKKWLPKDFAVPLAMDAEAAARMLLFCVNNQRTLAGYKASRVVRGVKVLSAQDACEACKKIDGKQYALDKAIELPFEHCTSPQGCRCMWVSVLK